MKPCGCPCFCPYCSASLIPTVPEVCAKCGAKLSEDYIFCPGCGVELGGNAPVEIAAPPPADPPAPRKKEPAPTPAKKTKQWGGPQKSLGDAALTSASVRFPKYQVAWLEHECKARALSANALLREITAEGIKAPPPHTNIGPGTDDAVGTVISYQITRGQSKAVKDINRNISFSHHVRSFVAHLMSNGAKP